MKKSWSVPVRKSQKKSKATPAASRHSLNGLQYEKCEPRHMLSGLSVVDTSGMLAPAQQQELLSHLAAQPRMEWMQLGDNSLQLVEVDRGVDTTVVFQNTIAGMPVHGSYVSIVQNSVTGQIEAIHNRGLGQAEAIQSTRPSLDIQIATQIANRGFTDANNIQSAGEMVWFVAGGQAQSAWQIDTIVAEANVNNADLEFQTVIDAYSGNVLSQVQSPSDVQHLIDDPQAATGIFPRIVINDTVGAAGSQAYAAPWDAVVALALGCTGTLVAENVVISARHCGASAGSTILFGDDSNMPDFSATVQSSSLPAGSGSLLDGGDVSILTLTGNVPASVATPMRFIDATGDLEDMLAATLGYGFNGVGSVGHQFSSDGIRWGGENIIDRYGSPAGSSGSNVISTDFDDGTAGANTIAGSDIMPVPFEATTAPGDSGGAVFVQQGGEWLIAGVLSGGTSSTSVYGDISWWTGTAIYRAQIEAVGGEFADAGLGVVSFDLPTYTIEDTVNISVTDANGIEPLSVVVTSDAGDSETIVLTTAGGGLYTGSIATTDDGVATEDGTLQVADGDTITVTYMDPDNGSGNPETVVDTAVVNAPIPPGIVAVDFDGTGDPAPTNWASVDGGVNETLNDLSDETAMGTAFDLAIAELGGGVWDDFAVTPAASSIPQHTNPLANVDGQIYTGGDPLRLTWSDLKPMESYEVYIMSAEGFYETIEQTVTITGDGTPITFDQEFAKDTLFINDQVGDSNRSLTEYGITVVANASGEIVIDITPIAGTQDVVLAGAAIYEVPPQIIDLLPPASAKFLDGSIDSGVLTDVSTSNDAYLSLIPSATTNLNKQIIEVINLAEYTGTTPGSFAFQVEASMTGGPEGDVIQSVELFNYQTGQWELFDSRAATNTDSIVNVSVAGTVADYIDPLTNEILAKTKWTSASFAGTPFTWTVDVDHMGWDIS